MIENVLAPTKAQRGRYLRYLYVFKKQKARLFKRHIKAVDNYNVSSAVILVFLPACSNPYVSVCRSA